MRSKFTRLNLNNDGHVDLIVGILVPDGIDVVSFLGSADGVFTEDTTIELDFMFTPHARSAVPLRIGDFDGDGDSVFLSFVRVVPTARSIHTGAHRTKCPLPNPHTLEIQDEHRRG